MSKFFMLIFMTIPIFVFYVFFNIDIFKVSMLIIPFIIFFIGWHTKEKNFFKLAILFTIFISFLCFLSMSENEIDKSYHLKFDYNKNQIIDLKHNRVIDNLSYFKKSNKTEITAQNMIDIENQLRKETRKMCPFCLKNVILFDDDNNHYIIDKVLLQKTKYDLKTIYFDNKNYSIKSIYENSDGVKLYKLQENIGEDEFYRRIHKYYF